MAFRQNDNWGSKLGSDPKKKPVRLNPAKDKGRVSGLFPGRVESYRLFEPKPGSVIPVRRKLVKRLMFDYIFNLGSSGSKPGARSSGTLISGAASGSGALRGVTRHGGSSRVCPYSPEHGGGKN